MGTNIIYLADRVPSYRRIRPRRATSPGAASTSAAAADPAIGPTAALAPEPGTASPAPSADSAWATLARQRAAARHTSRPCANPPATTIYRPTPTLRVTRMTESPAPASGSFGRLRISGRLMDVCAELERLAAAEALQFTAQPLRA